MPPAAVAAPAAKFSHPVLTATGERRAWVSPQGLKTLWINTGTLCNIACTGCYIDSSPRNDRLAWFPLADLEALIAEARSLNAPLREINFTGGEPFMHPQIMALLERALAEEVSVLVLTNAMKPLHHHLPALIALHRKAGGRLALRVSLDHYTPDGHEAVRGPHSWGPAWMGIMALAQAGLPLSLACRLPAGESADQVRQGFAALCQSQGLALDVADPWRLVLFPQMDETAPVPEITTACWAILKKSPDSLMCATSRMAVRRRGADRPAVLACTLLPYDPRFDLGGTLAEATACVPLNHPHCATFCVLGGAACSG